MPPITELTRIDPIHLQRLSRQGVLATGLLPEALETVARRQAVIETGARSRARTLAGE